jgi:hypothetical protein
VAETLRANLLANLERVRRRVVDAAGRAGRAGADVTLIGVTKSVEPPVARTLFDLGLRDLAENRVQELERKQSGLPSEVCWHLVGPIQSNKSRKALGLARWLHALDRWDLLAKLDALAAEMGIRARGFLEVNVSGEASKHGVGAGDALELLHRARGFANLDIAGLMTMAPLDSSAPDQRNIFRELRNLRDEADRKNLFRGARAGRGELSMGMSNDFEIAVEEGATMVRVGTALFENLERTVSRS